MAATHGRAGFSSAVHGKPGAIAPGATRSDRDRIAIGVQLVAGRTLPSNQCALSGDAAGLRAELSQIGADTALVGQQFPAAQLKPLIPLPPVIGGMRSSLIHILIVTPMIFLWLHERELRKTKH